MRNYSIIFVLAMLLFCNVVTSFAVFSTPHVWGPTDKAFRTWFNANFAAIEAALGTDAITTAQILDGTILNEDIDASAAIVLTKLSESVIQADGGQAFTGSVSHGDFNITNLGTLALDEIGADDATKGITIELSDNLTISAQFKEATNEYMAFVTTDAGEQIRLSQHVNIDGGTLTFNNSEADLDWRFAGSGETNLFYGDSGNDRIGIGTTTPGYLFEVAGDAYVSGVLYAGTTATYFDTDGNLITKDTGTVGILSGGHIMFDDTTNDEINLWDARVVISDSDDALSPSNLFLIYSDDNVASMNLSTGSSSADSFVRYDVFTGFTTKSWVSGVDNSNGDAFVITDSTAPTTSTNFLIEANGFVGIGTSNAASEMDVGGGTVSSIDGTDDLLVKDDAEINGKLFVDETADITGDINSAGSIFSDNVYVEDWTTCNGGGNVYTITHNLATTHVQVQIMISETANFTGDEFIVGGTMTIDSGSNRYGVTVCDIDTNAIKIVTGANIYLGYDSAGSTKSITNGYMRVTVFAWE